MNPLAGRMHSATADEAEPGSSRRGALVVLFLAMTGCLVIAGVRISYVQACLTESYARSFAVETEKREPIASRDGRVLTSSGEVLAEDVQRFEIVAHYRWLESPANSAWLRQQAVIGLDRKSQRNRALVSRRQAEVEARRDAMWQEFANVTGQSPETLRAARSQVQTRVERMRNRVLAQRDERQREREAQRHRAVEETIDPRAPWTTQLLVGGRILFTTLCETLTTSPQREPEAPLVMREELDYHEVLANVGLEVAARIEADRERFPGLRIRVRTERTYPRSDIAPHVIGYRAPVDSAWLAERKRQHPDGDPLGYQLGDRVGRMGLERSYEHVLRGLPGERRLTLNRYGEVIRDEVLREPRVGQDVVVTLDLAVQQRCAELLRNALQPPSTAIRSGSEASPNSPSTGNSPSAAGRDEVLKAVPTGGAIVALDVRTGAVLAAASAPEFDLKLFVEPSPAGWKAVQEDERKPLFCRFTSMALPPGSTFKPVTAVALLDAKAIEPDRPFYCAGYLDQPDRHRCLVFRHFGVGHYDVDLAEAMARSCNVYFFAGARKSGPGPLVKWADRFGFGRLTGVDLPGEKAGNLPTPGGALAGSAGLGTAPSANRADASLAKGRAWFSGDTLGLAIGQAQLTATPLQVARMMATIANDGELVTPHFVERVGSAHAGPVRVLAEADGSGAGDAGAGRIAPVGFDAEAERAARPNARLAELSPAVLAWVRKGLERVVSSPHGTGYKNVRLAEVSIAGKTGTAEQGGGRPDHAWFAGYVPADRPRIAFVVVLESAGSGGAQAGPLARELVRTLHSQGLLGTP